MALTGFLVDGQCMSTSSEALTLLQSQYPQIAGNNFVSVGTATFLAPNTVILRLKVSSLDANTVAFRKKTFTLSPCDPAFPVGGGTVFDPIVGGAFFSLALTWVLAMYLIAKQSGLILSFIRGRRG